MRFNSQTTRLFKYLLYCFTFFQILFCGYGDFQYDPTSPNYIEPSFVIDTNSIYLQNNDTIVNDSVKMILSGNDPLGNNMFRYKLDSTGWTTWKSVKDTGNSLSLKDISNGSHSITIQVCYDTIYKDFRESTISFLKVSKPQIAISPDTLIIVKTANQYTLHVQAKGTGVLTYIWYQGNVVADSGTTDSFTVKKNAPSDSLMLWSCKVKNALGESVCKGSIKFEFIPVILHFKVVYTKNGADTGNVPLDTTSYVDSATVKVLTNTGNLSKKEHYLAGWQKVSSKGDSTRFMPGDTFTIHTEDVTLAAIWKIDSSSVPVSPSEIKITPLDSLRVSISWKDNSAIETGYEIFRSSGKDSLLVKIGQVNAGATTFTDTGLKGGQTYFYAVKSIGKAVNSEITLGTPVTTDTITPPSISNLSTDQTHCIGDSVKLTLTVSGTVPFTYQWFKNNIAITGQVNNILKIQSLTINDTGTYSCRVGNIAGQLLTKDIILSIASPSVSATKIEFPATPLCSGTPILLSLTGGTLGTGASWKWYADSCSSPSIGTGAQLTVTPKVTTKYLVRAEGICNISDTVTATVNVKALSSLPSKILTDKSTICFGDSVLLSVNDGTLGAGASWEWYQGGCTGGTYIGTGSSIQVKPAATTSYSLRARGDCNTTDWLCTTITVRTLSVAPVSISTEKDTFCQGTSTLLTVTGGSLGTGASWHWYEGTCGSQAIDTGTSVTVKPQKTTTYFVRAEGLCNTTACASRTIYVDSLSIIPVSIAANPPEVCPGSSTTLSVIGGKLGTGAVWKWFKDSCNAVSIGSGPSIIVTPPPATTYFVRAEGKCNTTNCISTSISMKTISSPAASVSADLKTICAGETAVPFIIGGTLGTGAKWVWYANDTNSASIGNGTEIIVTPKDTTRYFVRAEGDCDKTAFKSVTINVDTLSKPPTSISATTTTTYCPGTSVTLTAVGAVLRSGARLYCYAGSCGGTPVAQSTTSSITVAPPLGNTTYYIRAEGHCGNTTCASITIKVYNSSCPYGSSASSIKSTNVISNSFQISDF